MNDSHHLPITTSSTRAAEAFQAAVQGYLKYRLDTPAHLKAALDADPGCAIAHCLGGYLAMLSYKQANVPLAEDALRKASIAAGDATLREQAHVQALSAWIAGELDRAIAVWENVLADHPTDVVALRLSHFNNFWLGRPRDMRSSLDRVASRWNYAVPGYEVFLACRAFAHEECGDYLEAERFGRESVDLDPANVWGAHAVAHVMEMQGRHEEGLAWIDLCAPHWNGLSNIVHHLWWHRAMYHLERREWDAVIALYDQRFRNLESPLCQAQPDVYIDIQNAASMLFRLERQGVNVGNRWIEIADQAEARIGDALSAFTLPHWMMALAAADRFVAARTMLDALAEIAKSKTTIGGIVSRVALPICAAIVHHRRGEHERALDLMRPILGEFFTLGGSHAQQDVLEQLYLDAALKANRPDDIRVLLARVKAHHPLPPQKRCGYALAAQRYAP
ncbi:MAG: tetratricopeptide repeat protein [Burkholderiales bacterium]